MRGLLAALKFLTIIPIQIDDAGKEDMPKAITWFPFVGFILSLALVAINSLFISVNFNNLLSSIIIFLMLTIMTGAIHLDGLADTMDAFFSGKSKDEMLKIMREPTIGTMGSLGLIFILMIQIAAFSSISPTLKNGALVLMCVLSRYSMVVSMFLFPYARAEGKAKNFTKGINARSFIISTFMAVALSLMAIGLKGVIIFILVSLSTFIANKYIKSKIDGITGDTLGAMNEFSATFVVLWVYLLG